jgi:glycosyltransferase involved in cell wall biosynthesis
MVNEMNNEISPLISVVMSLYNSELYLREAMDSVFSQTFNDFEFIIVDDGSSDGGEDIVHSYDDDRIHYFRQENAGLAAALNTAISMARGDLIARMDPDDICLPKRLAKQYDYMQHNPEMIIVGSAATCIDASGAILADVQMRHLYLRGELSLPETPCIHPSVLFRRSIFDRVGGYSEEMRYGGEDAVLFNKMLAFGAVANISEPLIKYRLTNSSMSQKSKRFNLLLRQRVYKEVSGEDISKIEKKNLAEEYKRPKSGLFGYHLYVGKLLITNRGKQALARTHFYKALKRSPLSVYTWTFLVVSYLPSQWQISLLTIIRKLKNRCG